MRSEPARSSKTRLTVSAKAEGAGCPVVVADAAAFLVPFVCGSLSRRRPRICVKPGTEQRLTRSIHRAGQKLRQATHPTEHNEPRRGGDSADAGGGGVPVLLYSPTPSRAPTAESPPEARQRQTRRCRPSRGSDLRQRRCPHLGASASWSVRAEGERKSVSRTECVGRESVGVNANDRFCTPLRNARRCSRSKEGGGWTTVAAFSPAKNTSLGAGRNNVSTTAMPHRQRADHRVGC